MLPFTQTKRRKDYRYLVYPDFLTSLTQFDCVVRHIEYDPDCFGSLVASHLVYTTIIVTTSTQGTA